jgi:hypothetical protein
MAVSASAALRSGLVTGLAAAQTCRNGVAVCVRVSPASLALKRGVSGVSGGSGVRAFRRVAVSSGIRFPSVGGRGRELRTVAGVSQLEEGPMETSEHVPYVDSRVAVTIITGFLGAGKVRVQ